MILLLDIGNTRIKWGWLQEGMFRSGGGIAHGRDPAQVLADWAATPRPQRVLAVSVANQQLNDAAADWIKRHWNLDVELVHASAVAGGVRNSYANPGQLGADRWVAAIGAYALSRTAVCVVDCGSALTMDAVDAEGQHRGGLIAPGWQLMRESLHRGTARLPLAGADAVQLFSTDTDSAIASGTLLGAAAIVDQLAGRMAAELGGAAALWLTGGGAPALLPYLTLKFRHEPDLVLQGLAVLANTEGSGLVG